MAARGQRGKVGQMRTNGVGLPGAFLSKDTGCALWTLGPLGLW